MRRALLLLLLPGLLGLAACGGSDSAAAATKVRALDLKVPDQILDLKVVNESIKAVEGTKRPFVDAVALVSLRRGDLLQATLQVSRFTNTKRAKTGRFRRSVVDQIGSTVPKPFRMGEHTVYLTTGRRQSIGVWFRDQYLFVLSTRDEYEQPRLLLRELLELKV